MEFVLMSFIELLALQLGPAIAKAILKVWFKDSSIATDISSSFVDIIKLKTNDVIAQQKAKRQFEEIGEKVAGELWPMLEADGLNLDEGSKTSVILAVADTLACTRLDSQILLEKDLEPSLLANHLMESLPERTRDFSATETGVYRQLVAESC